MTLGIWHFGGLRKGKGDQNAHPVVESKNKNLFLERTVYTAYLHTHHMQRQRMWKIYLDLTVRLVGVVEEVLGVLVTESAIHFASFSLLYICDPWVHHASAFSAQKPLSWLKIPQGNRDEFIFPVNSLQTIKQESSQAILFSRGLED